MKKEQKAKNEREQGTSGKIVKRVRKKFLSLILWYCGTVVKPFIQAKSIDPPKRAS